MVEGGVDGAGDAGDGRHGLQRYDAQQLRPRVLKCGERSMRMCVCDEFTVRASACAHNILKILKASYIISFLLFK